MNLEAAVRAGEGQRQFGGFSAERQQIFSAGVEAFSAASAGALVANYDFGRHRRVLDVAGGSGSFLIRSCGAIRRIARRDRGAQRDCLDPNAGFGDIEQIGG